VIPIGTQVKPYGEVSAVGMTGGERYYWFVDKSDRAVSMMPASVIEPMFEREGKK
jgi:hypothetical protein